MGTMHVAAVGYDPGIPGIEAVDFGSAGTLGSCDALIWSPAGLIDEYRDVYTRAGDEQTGPLLSLAASTRLLSDSRRRREDFNNLLERGGVLVVNPCGGPALRVHAIEDVQAFDPEETLPRGLRPGMVATDEFEIAEFRGGQPFRAFAEGAGACVPASAALESFSGVPLFLGVRTGAVLGGYLFRHPGHLLFLPRPAPAERDASERWHRALLPLLATLERRGPGFRLPDWCEEFAVPGEAKARRTLRTLLSERERLRREIEDMREKLSDQDRQKALFACEGAALAAATALAFERSGALVLPELLGPGTLVLEHRGRFAVVLVVDRAGEKDAAPRLQTLLDAFTQSFGGIAKGIVVHGRGLPPDRGNLADEQLHRRIERDGHCYLTGWDLFRLMGRSSRPEEALLDLFAAMDGQGSSNRCRR